MKKLTLTRSSLLIVMSSYSQIQCSGLTKSNDQCKNIVKQGNLCYLHDLNYTKPSETETKICSGITKSKNKCKNKTKNKSGLCHNHKKD